MQVYIQPFYFTVQHGLGYAKKGLCLGRLSKSYKSSQGEEKQWEFFFSSKEENLEEPCH